MFMPRLFFFMLALGPSIVLGPQGASAQTAYCPPGTCSKTGDVFADTVANCGKDNCAAYYELNTCSGSQAFCVRGMTNRKLSSAACQLAYRGCMQTGVWRIEGVYGGAVAGVTKR
jgi:hypothetical protein